MLVCKLPMRLVSRLRIGLLIAGVWMSAVCLPAQEENTKSTEAQGKDSQAKGMPPRAAPSEYQAQAQAGTVTIAAEFMGHAVPTPEQTVAAEDYVVVEAGLFGSPGARSTLARGDFSLRINGKKIASPSEPYELVFKSLKDPEWVPPEQPEESKSKSSISTGGGGGGGGAGQPPPAPPKMPFPLRRAMEQHVQKAAMQEGDRPLPQAGLLFFLYRGKVESIHSLELIYSGSAGNATLTLQP
jgi:hypothetical protein